MSPADVPVLRLKRNEERRIQAGHPWVFSNEIDTAATPLTALTPGQAVQLWSARDRFLGHAYANPHSLICARVMSRDPDLPIGPKLLERRLRAALELRQLLSAEPFGRLVFGESDQLPGLVLDRFGDIVVGQIATAGMEVLRPLIEAAVRKVIAPRSLYWKNDSGARALEQLPQFSGWANGQMTGQMIGKMRGPTAGRRAEAGDQVVDQAGDRAGSSPGDAEADPSDAEIMVRENGIDFIAPLAEGQKTGWFYDQAANRRRLGAYLKPGSRVLDVCSYVGAWAVAALRHGAASVTCVDASQVALDYATRNAAAGGHPALETAGGRPAIETIRGDAFDVLKALHERGERFDAVILDPPAFIKRKKDIATGQAAYRKLNQLGMNLLGEEGLLVSCSCSYHLAEADLLAGVQAAARHNGRFAQVLEVGLQSPDHPLHPAIPETRYLKGLFCRVTRD